MNTIQLFWFFFFLVFTRFSIITVLFFAFVSISLTTILPPFLFTRVYCLRPSQYFRLFSSPFLYIHMEISPRKCLFCVLRTNEFSFVLLRRYFRMPIIVWHRNSSLEYRTLRVRSSGFCVIYCRRSSVKFKRPSARSRPLLVRFFRNKFCAESNENVGQKAKINISFYRYFR